MAKAKRLFRVQIRSYAYVLAETAQDAELLVSVRHDEMFSYSATEVKPGDRCTWDDGSLVYGAEQDTPIEAVWPISEIGDVPAPLQWLAEKARAEGLRVIRCEWDPEGGHLGKGRAHLVLQRSDGRQIYHSGWGSIDEQGRFQFTGVHMSGELHERIRP